jgi:DNA-binding NarL/FixJ family response regulator
MKKVFIVEDHPIVRKGLRGLIESHGGYKVCGTMDRAEGAVCKIISSDADVVLVDISLPGQDGLQLIDELHSRRACLPILVLSMYDSNVYAERALRAGAMGYIKKQEATERVLEGIEAVLGGNVYINKDVESLLSGYKSNNSNWLRNTSFWFCIFIFVSACSIGICSKSEMLRICSIS